MSYVVASESFDLLESDWKGLLACSAANEIFLTPLWQRLWWHWIGQDCGLLLLSARNSAGLRGVAPLVQKGDTLAFLGSTDLVDYHDFIVADDDTRGIFEAFASYLARQPDWRILCLESLPEGSEALEQLPNVLKVLGLNATVELEGVSPGIQLPGTWDQYLASLRKKDRHELRRKLRRLESAGTIRFYVVTDAADLPEAMDCFLELMRESRGDKAEFMTEKREAFFRDMAREFLEADLLKLFFLELDGARVATTLCMDYQGTRFLYNSGFDRTYDHLSVGLLLKVLCLRDAIALEMNYFDLLRGDERYKYDLGAKDVRIYTMTVRKPANV